MKHILKTILAYQFIILLPLLFSCSKNDEVEIDPNKTGNIELKFDNVVGNRDFAFDVEYQNASNETFTVSLLQYYIFNLNSSVDSFYCSIVSNKETFTSSI